MIDFAMHIFIYKIDKKQTKVQKLQVRILYNKYSYKFDVISIKLYTLPLTFRYSLNHVRYAYFYVCVYIVN